MTHVLHVSEDHSVRNTGITTVVDAVLRNLPQIQQSLLCTDPETISIPQAVRTIRLTPGRIGRPWRYPGSGRQALRAAVQEADLVHLHGIWMWVQWAAAREAQAQKRPAVLTVHGMLEPWMWNYQGLLGKWKKDLYWNRIARPAFCKAALLHAITPLEAEHLHAFFPGVRIEIIPHGLNLAEIDRQGTGREAGPSFGEPYILFMGRLHPKKGLELLLSAFSTIQNKQVKLKIAGPAQDRQLPYLQLLKEQVRQLDLTGRVEFLGRVDGDEKWKLYREAWAFCLPSYSEVIGMVNLEAAACRTPVLASTECGLVQGWDRAGGAVFALEQDALSAALNQAASWSESERCSRGASLRRLVESYYNWDVIAPQWLSLYQECGNRIHG